MLLSLLDPYNIRREQQDIPDYSGPNFAGCMYPAIIVESLKALIEVSSIVGLAVTPFLVTPYRREFTCVGVILFLLLIVLVMPWVTL